MNTYQTFFLPSEADGLPLHLLFSRADQPHGVLQICHGMAEHKERYLPFMEFLSQNGYHCLIHDHRGHGQSILSQEDLGYFYENGAQALVQDVYTVNRYLHTHYMGLPVYLLGHSMGSLVARSYCRKFDNTISGLILIGSPSKKKGVSFGKRLAALIAAFQGEKYRSRLLQQLTLGSFSKKFPRHKSENSWLCSDRQVVSSYDSDPLCGFCFTANGFSVLFSLFSDAYDPEGWNLNHEDLPVFFLSGADDACALSRGDFLKSVSAMRKAGYTDVNSKMYPGMRHEILNETKKTQVFADILSFLENTGKSGVYKGTAAEAFYL